MVLSHGFVQISETIPNHRGGEGSETSQHIYKRFILYSGAFAGPEGDPFCFWHVNHGINAACPRNLAWILDLRSVACQCPDRALMV